MDTNPLEDKAIEYAERIKSLSESFTAKEGRDCWNAAELIIWSLCDRDDPRRAIAMRSLRAALAKDIINEAYKHAAQVINEAIARIDAPEPTDPKQMVFPYNGTPSPSTPCDPR